MTNQNQIMEVVSSIKCTFIFFLTEYRFESLSLDKQNVCLLYFKYYHPILLRTPTKFSQYTNCDKKISGYFK